MILSKSDRQLGLAIFALLIFSGPALAQGSAANEAVVVKRPSQLRDAPGEASRSLVSLPVQTSVTRLGERQGPWIKVRMADGSIGWIHMFDVTSASGSTQATTGIGASALRGISSFFNKGSAQAPATTVATSTVGIRGLGAENLANSQPNLAAVAQADVLRLDGIQARRFAETAALTARQIEPLPAPSPAPAAAPATPSGSTARDFAS